MNTMSLSREHTSDGHGTCGGRFEQTQWTLILKALDENAPGAQAAMENLARTYWPALYGFIRREGYRRHDAQDLTQSFYAHLQDKHLLERVKERRGRFRNYLLTCLKYFLSDERDRARALKRGGGTNFISLDALEAEERDALEPADGLTAEQIYEQRWTVALLQRVEQRLREECAGDEAALSEALMALPEDRAAASRHAAIAARFGISVSAVKAKAHRLRQCHKRLLREEIGRTVCRRQDIDEEIRHLFCVLGG